MDKGNSSIASFCIFFSGSLGLIVMDALAQFTKLAINGQSSFSVS